MHLSLLETFRAVVEKGTTQAAAQALGLSQSAVSRRIAQLEEDLGLQLFVRDRGRLIATRENQLLQAQIAGLVDHGARLTQRAAELKVGNYATEMLRVAFPASLTISIVPAILAEFLERNERVQVELHTGAYDTIERMVLDERAEVGFLRMPTQRSGLDTTPVIEVPTVCVMPRGHPLADRKEVSISDLHAVPLILLGRMRLPRRDIDEAFWEVGMRPLVRVEAHSVQSACALAARGLGVTLVNELMARDFAHLPIEIRPLRERLLHRFAFAVTDGIPPTEIARQFIETSIARFRSLLAEDQTSR
ncbi:MAG: LysR family transcriptional regulator [Pseudotabrizicola sp.]|uniref:LysR family transcriptional regulator n=1 Tax=Pseudotabrizicola sp. TaxID=2939647 RepID=UPI00272118E0|nr:LysR family transcriptional regulator [Pseudotabrizicola sp.]MDO9638275.1 LysR family transcriptional regulator [Pseudotabrizicola sp.]